MGFTTGFIGGVTLTTGILYLSVAAHKRNRAAQALVLRQQALQLEDIADPARARREAQSILRAPAFERESRASVLELAKDRWNNELEAAVRKFYDTDWNAVREGAEDVGAAVVRSLRNLGSS